MPAIMLFLMAMATLPMAMLTMDIMPILLMSTTDTVMPTTATTRGLLMLRLLMAMLTMVMATPPTVMPTMDTMPILLMPTMDTVMPTMATTRGLLMLRLPMVMLTTDIVPTLMLTTGTAMPTTATDIIINLLN